MEFHTRMSFLSNWLLCRPYDSDAVCQELLFIIIYHIKMTFVSVFVRFALFVVERTSAVVVQQHCESVEYLYISRTN